MDPRISNTLDNLQIQNFDEAELAIYALEDWIIANFKREDFATVKEIKDKLEKITYKYSIVDKTSFLLGKMYSIIELVDNLLIPIELEKKLNSISDWEKRVLQYIYISYKITPKEITQKFRVNKQQISNILSSLRLKDLVTVKPYGRHRWYSVTPIGQEVLKKASQREQKKIINNNDIYSISSNYVKDKIVLNNPIEKMQSFDYFIVINQTPANLSAKNTALKYVSEVRDYYGRTEEKSILYR